MILFHGLEPSLIFFELMVFVVVDIFACDFILAAIVTYFVQQIIRSVSLFGAKKNLVAKAMMDGRFLF